MRLSRWLRLLGHYRAGNTSRHDKRRQHHPRNPASCHQGSGRLRHHTRHRFNLSSSFASARHEAPKRLTPYLACCRMNDPVKPAVALQRLQVKTFDDDVFPIGSRTIFERRPYDRGALAPVLRAMTALMLLQQAKLETLKIGRANDRMRLRSGFRNALMRRDQPGRRRRTQPLCARSAGIAHVMAHARPTACMTRKSADGTACIVAASAACRASTSARRFGCQPHGQPPSERC